MINTTLTTEKVADYTVMLCDALYMNFKDAQIAAHKRSIANEVNMDYHQSKIDEIMDNGAPIEFFVRTARKYLKVMMKDSGGSISIHALLIVTLVMYTNLPVSKHLPRVYATISSTMTIVRNSTPLLIGQVVISTLTEVNYDSTIFY